MRTSLKFEFVEFIPSQLEEGILYITVAYKAAAHLCACGCGNKVLTPVTPNDWKLTYDGKSVSLSPSIGNWSFDCKSHYFIKKNEIKIAPSWSQEEMRFDREKTTKKRWRLFNKKKKKK